MYRRTLALLVALTLVGALAACGNDDEDSNGDDGDDPTTQTTEEEGTTDEDIGNGDDAAIEEDAATEAPDMLEVVVLDPGSEPRRELRLDLEPGSTFNYTMTLITTTTVEISSRKGTEVEATGTTTEIDLEARVHDVDDGVADIELVYTGARLLSVEGENLDRREIAQLEEDTEDLVGSGMRMGLDTRGQTHWLEALPGIDDWVVEMMEDIVPDPLPAEPVGVGARWRIETDLATTPGLETVVSEYHLVAVDGDTIATEVTFTMIPSSTGFGAMFDEESMRGEGTVSWDLTMPRGYEDFVTGFTMSLVTGQGDNQVETSTRVTMETTTTG